MHKQTRYRFSPNLAYIVGLITSDGSLSKDKRHVDFTSTDLQLLRTFKKCLSLKNRICEKGNSSKSKRKSYHLQFGNVKLYNWLLKLGLMPNKTYHLGEMDIPKIYFRDFLRGHLDGDGSIVTYTDRYMSYKNRRYKYQRIYLTFYSSSLKHIEWIQSRIKEVFDIKGSLLGWNHKNSTIMLWKLRFAKNDSLKLLSWIYYKPDLPCLVRKRRIAERFLKNLREINYHKKALPKPRESL